MFEYSEPEIETFCVCEPVAKYEERALRELRQRRLFDELTVNTSNDDISVIELFAGVGGFRIGFERASERYKTVWNNQWEPDTKRQDASTIYCNRFGFEGHSNEDISKVPTEDIPQADILCGGFPCQDYSVATTLSNSKGIEGKKGVLWWQIYRILKEKGDDAPKYLVLENVDRLLVSPAKRRGRDFALILASLSDLGYMVEWRVINAAEYGMPQRRRRTYIVGYRKGSNVANQWETSKDAYKWILEESVLGVSFESIEKPGGRKRSNFTIKGDLYDITDNFNKSENNSAASPFRNAGFMSGREVWTLEVVPVYSGSRITLGQIIVPEKDVPEEFFISEEDLPKWEYLKGSKSEQRITKSGFKYNYAEGSMAFPDSLDKPSRTIITGEGGVAPSRFKHVVQTESGRYRRLVPIELERLNMFPDNHTIGASNTRRAFLMGNALVVGIIERIGLTLSNMI